MASRKASSIMKNYVSLDGREHQGDFVLQSVDEINSKIISESLPNDYISTSMENKSKRFMPVKKIQMHEVSLAQHINTAYSKETETGRN